MPSKQEKGSHPSLKRAVKIKNKTYRATGVVKVPIEQYSKKKPGKSKDLLSINNFVPFKSCISSVSFLVSLKDQSYLKPAQPPPVTDSLT